MDFPSISRPRLLAAVALAAVSIAALAVVSAWPRLQMALRPSGEGAMVAPTVPAGDVAPEDGVRRLRVANSGVYFALDYVALGHGDFAAEKIDVTVTPKLTGAESTAALMAGEYDVAAMGDYAAVLALYEHPELRILGTMMSSPDLIRLVVRTDHGISSAADLRGKRVSVVPASPSQFFLDFFLTVNGVTPKQVQQVPTKPGDDVSLLVSGKVDAAAAVEPYATRLREALPDQTASWPIQGRQRVYGVIVTTQRFIDRHGELVDAYLRGLAGAEAFVASDRQAAKKTLVDVSGFSAADLDVVWPLLDVDFGMRPDAYQALEGLARTVASRGLSGGVLLDVHTRVSSGPLARVKPGAVTDR